MCDLLVRWGVLSYIWYSGDEEKGDIFNNLMHHDGEMQILLADIKTIDLYLLRYVLENYNLKTH